MLGTGRYDSKVSNTPNVTFRMWHSKCATLTANMHIVHNSNAAEGSGSSEIDQMVRKNEIQREREFNIVESKLIQTEILSKNLSSNGRPGESIRTARV